MKKNTFSVIIVPHDLKKTRTYKVPYPLFYTFVVVAGIGLVVLIVFIATYGRVLLKAREAVELEKQVEELTKRAEKVAELRRNIARMRELDLQIRQMLGLPIDTQMVAEKELIASAEDIPSDRISAAHDQLLKSIPTFWPVRGFITRGFSISGGKGSPNYHPGIDIAVDEGTPVLAAASGVVVETGWDDIYGYYVVIDHGFGLKTLYGHNERVVVMKDERVVRGQTIAYSGNTGRSTAPHLHFEVIKDNVPVDPMKYLLK